tara:strand:- start:155 stop:415 length:261 start_codon:yes stop_codon:yes gene_type:complete
MSNNCEKINGHLLNVPFRSYAGTDLTDYRSSNERENELRLILTNNGCKPNNSYDARICLQNNSNIAKSFLDRSFKNSLGSNVCQNN